MPTELFIRRTLEISDKSERARVEYPSLWHSLIREWENASDDAVWLTYAANYLVHTCGVHWALDPYNLFNRIGGEFKRDFAADLAPLQLIVLSHIHNDHFDPRLLAELQNLPITWVVPSFMVQAFSEKVKVPSNRLLIPQPGQTIRINDLTLTPFESLHFRQTHGVPEMGYLAEFCGKRWLFPGDIRTYDLTGMPNFEHLDGIYAHLWLGKASALQDTPPLLQEFCSFFAAMQPKTLIVTHMEELGRSADEYWNMDHFHKIETQIKTTAPAIKLQPALMGQKNPL